VKLRVYTVGEMLDLRYGGSTSAISGVVMRVNTHTPIFYGLGTSLVLYVVVSLFTPRTSDAILTTWTRRLTGSAAAEEAVKGESPVLHQDSGVAK
jgi:SSS family solute:Na+ symporter